MPTRLETEEAVLWMRYRAAGNATQKCAARNALTEFYLPLLGACARRLSNRLPAHVGPEDLRGEGVVGLFNAIDQFDAERGVAFSTYARHKINSAMMDYLRRIDDVSRQLRRRLRQIERSREKFLQRFGRPATESEVAADVGLTAQQVRAALHAAPLRLSQSPGEDAHGDGPGSLTHTLPDPRAIMPDADAERASMRRHVLDGLSRAEQLIVVLYYYESLSMREIGVALDLSESRVSQMHTSILARLRARFGEDAGRMRELLPRTG